MGRLGRRLRGGRGIESSRRRTPAPTCRPGGAIGFQNHYTPYGKETVEKTQIGLYFYKDGETPKYVMHNIGIANPSIVIPPNEEYHHEIAYLEFPHDALLYSAPSRTPTTAAARRTFAIQYPDGQEVMLLALPRYDFNWQRDYTFAEPMKVPAGSKLIARYTYDNSKRNPANPDPNRTVPWGDQSFDEMLYTALRYRWVDETSDHMKPDYDKQLQANRMMGMLDDNLDGKIEKAELKGKMGEGLKAKFALIDKNHDGVIDAKEWKVAMSFMANQGRRRTADAAPKATTADKLVGRLGGRCFRSRREAGRRRRSEARRQAGHHGFALNMTAPSRRLGLKLGGGEGSGPDDAKGGPARGLPFLLAAVALFAASQPSAQDLAQPVTGKPAPAFAAKAIDGRPVSLAAHRGKIVVLEWTSPVCPFTTKKYEKGAMQAVQRDARKAGVVWITVNTAYAGSPGHLTPAQAKARIADQHMTVSAFVEDDGGRLGRAWGAKATPQVFIVAPDGKLAFQGGVDDDPYAADGPKALDGVKDALADLEAHRPVRVSDIRPYGCPVEYGAP